ncbi:Alpha-(1,3)-fucosyltransferase, family GT10 [Trypanosoma rangeli]|uniref:Fucosyltransferase n=1 Tax=Trypanosoma rangeli TaxID=5698 RepID=A0A422MWV9_TRYRA|nr:Alpha-(1,3)-fucosyltransferase, family GT10 [Trypanosoma rangeli]RNE97693.1 Alpha-(1,3)-fucosyltransferase, family GT10 [Trypanosoma rangeli]|eukprot:RNE97693.1 Alpha-(1,3)-fucosyltransferase, family GT10 [Trypanosoma rangeli]
MRWRRCRRRGVILLCCVFALLCLWGAGGGGVGTSAPEAGRGPVGSRRRVEPFGGGNDVLVVPTRPGTYLCEYMVNATVLPQGCAQSCGGDGREGGGDFNCYVRSRHDARELLRADIAINHNGPVPARPSRQRPPHLTLFYTGESNHTDRKRGAEAYQRLYDAVVSFHQHRRYYFTWAHRQLPNFLNLLRDNDRSPAPSGSFDWAGWRQRQSAVAVFVSRCKARRADFIRRLSKHYPVHSFGACARNRKMPAECARLAGRYPQKLCVFQRYKYAMALENSRETDYVTEKVYHALLSGAVPLYWGAPNVAEFVPAGRASIVELEELLPGQLGDAAAESAEDAFRGFGEHLRRLEGDEASVRRLLRWRRARRAAEWGEGFLRNLYHPDPLCALCAEARAKRSQTGGGK